MATAGVNSVATPRFWDLFHALPVEIQELAIKNYDLWRRGRGRRTKPSRLPDYGNLQESRPPLGRKMDVRATGDSLGRPNDGRPRQSLGCGIVPLRTAEAVPRLRRRFEFGAVSSFVL